MYYPANKRRRTNAVLMMSQRRVCWLSIYDHLNVGLMLGQRRRQGPTCSVGLHASYCEQINRAVKY